VVDPEGAALGDLLTQARQYLQAAAGCVRCAPEPVSDFEELGGSLRDRAAAFEVRIRSSH